MMGDGNIESPYTGRDFVQLGKTKSVLNKGAQEDALLFNPPSVLSLEIILSSFILFPPPPSFSPLVSFHKFILSNRSTQNSFYTLHFTPPLFFYIPLAFLSLFYLYLYNSPYLNTKK